MLLAGASVVALIVGGPAASARNILSGPTAAPVATITPQQAQAAQAAQLAARRGRDSLARTTRALQAMRSAQAAARDLAIAAPSPIPNGLGTGGLQPVRNPNSTTDGLAAWIGADSPTQKPGTGPGTIDVNIHQTESRAVLSWETFNVGRETTLTFDQQGNTDWIALNRVVGNDAKPSEIRGSIKADGTVLIINHNDVLFTGTAQIDVHSLLASTLEVGRAFDFVATGTAARTIAQRNAEFLASGLLGFNDTSVQAGATFSAQRIQVGTGTQNDPLPEGSVTVAAGARITAGKDGLILLTGPQVINAGHLSATDGQVVLQSGREILLRRSEGKATSIDPNIRGVVAASVRNLGDPDDSVVNTATGLIEANRGNITLGGFSTVTNQGLLSSTTSVSRNGSIVLSAADIKLAPGGILSIGADEGPDVIPQDAASIAAFKPSSIVIGNRNGLGATVYDASARIEIGRDALIRAPGATVEIGARAGAAGASDQQGQGNSHVVVDSGAVIDVAG
ncbi:filamentous hemagglutinin N-terminal domain-containing protein [Oleomonas cavernae]|uniref:Filamentous hemagglutinin N-terminal domain-containing protein n=1 Tax=Oleomonas cavernae TaxID=2320859 RepID=A0A418W9C5_9PROT|nr:filamentous hemagglutinin N-terminal domain-containing protein [Oleomonas cavernae]